MPKPLSRHHDKLRSEGAYLSDAEVRREYVLRGLRNGDTLWSKGENKPRLDDSSWREDLVNSPSVWSRYQAAKAKKEEIGDAWTRVLEYRDSFQQIVDWFKDKSKVDNPTHTYDRLWKEFDALIDDLAVALDAEIERFQRDKELRRRQWEVQLTHLDGLKKLSPQYFEMRVADLFKSTGCTVQVTPASGDHGVDVIVTHAKKRYAIQCKRFVATQVGRPDCQKLLGAIIGGRYAGGVIVTTDRLTSAAIEFCNANRIAFIEGDKLGQFVAGNSAPDLIALLNSTKRSR